MCAVSKGLKLQCELRYNTSKMCDMGHVPRWTKSRQNSDVNSDALLANLKIRSTYRSVRTKKMKNSDFKEGILKAKSVILVVY